MTPQKKAAVYKKRAIEQAHHLAEFFQWQYDMPVKVTCYEKDKACKFFNSYIPDAALWVDGNTWNDLYVNLKTIEEVYEFGAALKSAALQLEEE